MLIHHKGVYHERFDAPFVGTLISSLSCDKGCKGCINTPLDDYSVSIIDHNDLLDSILSDPFSDGIILGGREWTLQADEMMSLIRGSKSRGLECILYTYHTPESLLESVPEIYERDPLTNNYLYEGLYIKHGMYDESLRSDDHVSYGVPLATTNQYIVRL